MIVLAIAAVILLGVLLVVPALQRAGRNQARERDVGTIITTINNYRASFGHMPPADAYNPVAGTGFDIAGKSTDELGYYNVDGVHWLKILNSANSRLGVGVLTDASSWQGATVEPASAIWAIKIEIVQLSDFALAQSEGVIVLVGWSCTQNALQDTGSNYLKDIWQPASSNVFAVLYTLEGDDTLLCRDTG